MFSLRQAFNALPAGTCRKVNCSSYNVQPVPV